MNSIAKECNIQRKFNKIRPSFEQRSLGKFRNKNWKQEIDCIFASRGDGVIQLRWIFWPWTPKLISPKCVCVENEKAKLRAKGWWMIHVRRVLIFIRDEASRLFLVLPILPLSRIFLLLLKIFSFLPSSSASFLLQAISSSSWIWSFLYTPGLQNFVRPGKL